jgi:hypothetical protein
MLLAETHEYISSFLISSSIMSNVPHLLQSFVMSAILRHMHHTIAERLTIKLSG